MFEKLKKFDKILVTGPQRSGTAICATMIAHDTDKKLYLEGAVNIDHLPLLRKMMESKEKFVLQIPALCHICHIFGKREDTVIIMVKRPVKDIIASQKRIGWPWEEHELSKYGMTHGIISDVKYRFWKGQKKDCANTFEINYRSLSRHPLWIKKEYRSNFNIGQTA